MSYGHQQYRCSSIGIENTTVLSGPLCIGGEVVVHVFRVSTAAVSSYSYVFLFFFCVCKAIISIMAGMMRDMVRNKECKKSETHRRR